MADPLNVHGEATVEPILIDAKKAAMVLSISPRLLWSMTNSGEVPCVRLRSRVLYRVEALREWLIEREQEGGR